MAPSWLLLGGPSSLPCKLLHWSTWVPVWQAAVFPQSKRRQREQGRSAMFYDLTLEVTHHTFCSTVTWISRPYFVWEGTMQGCKILAGENHWVPSWRLAATAPTLALQRRSIIRAPDLHSQLCAVAVLSLVTAILYRHFRRLLGKTWSLAWWYVHQDGSCVMVAEMVRCWLWALGSQLKGDIVIIICWIPRQDACRFTITIAQPVNKSHSFHFIDEGTKVLRVTCLSLYQLHNQYERTGIKF